MLKSVANWISWNSFDTLFELLQATFLSTPSLPKRILPDIRYDGIDHIMTKAASQGRCKLEGCRSYIWYQCGKCHQRLHQKCFVLFHLPKHDSKDYCMDEHTACSFVLTVCCTLTMHFSMLQILFSM